MTRFGGDKFMRGPGRCGQQTAVGMSSVAIIVTACIVGGVLGWYFVTMGQQILYTFHDDTFQLRNSHRDGVQLEMMGAPQDPFITANLQRHLVKTAGNTRSGCDSGDTCLRWDDLDLTLTSTSIGSLSCVNITWRARLDDGDTYLEDCFSMQGHWYGGAQDYHQRWPLEKWSRPREPFVAGDSYGKQIGGVLERYFLSSSGVAIYVPPDVPLWTSFNYSESGELCLSAQYRNSPYRYDFLPPTLLLQYSVCRSDDVVTTHKQMIKEVIGFPTQTPDSRVLLNPIWSTWAQYKKDINQSLVLEFANNIISNNFSYSQLEIDDMWSPTYGDFVFDSAKFPNPKAMTDELHSKNFKVTLWTHPFFNLDATAFEEANERRLLMRDPGHMWNMSSVVFWWDGSGGILDVTNPEARKWYLDGLNSLKTTAGIDSFKFDAGERVWLPHCFDSYEFFGNPDVYAEEWAKIALQADPNLRIQEVRVGAKSQRLPILVRMMDKDSVWTNENGLATLIPAALTFGILGYPFVLPDMIGGNAYNGSLTGKVYPEPELFVRWAQVTALMPAMQFSVVPWLYTPDVIRMSRDAVNLRTKYSTHILEAARQTTETGAPMVRPLWWVAPHDKQAHVIDDEFLLGDDLLVAPVVHKSAIKRDIYFPVGTWRDPTSGRVYTGPTWQRDFPAPLPVLPHFLKTSSS